MYSKKLRRQRWAREVKQARTEAGMTQEELAMNSAYSLAYIQKFETAARGTAEAFEHLIGVIRDYMKAGNVA